MKKKITFKNKSRLSLLFKLSKGLDRFPEPPSFESISKLKKKGQIIYYRRIKRLEKVNQRQLKKMRKNQIKSGLCGSRFDGMCKISLKPASAVFKK